MPISLKDYHGFDTLSSWLKRISSDFDSMNLYLRGFHELTTPFRRVFPNVRMGLNGKKTTLIPVWVLNEIERIPNLKNLSIDSIVAIFLSWSNLTGDHEKYDAFKHDSRWQYKKKVDRLIEMEVSYFRQNFPADDESFVNMLTRMKDSYAQFEKESLTPAARTYAQGRSKRLKEREETKFKTEFESRKNEVVERITEFISVLDLETKPEVAQWLLENRDQIRYVGSLLRKNSELLKLLDDERFQEALKVAIIKKSMDS